MGRVAGRGFIEAALAEANKYRAKHGAPPLTIDEGLNADAQAYAEQEAAAGVQKHSMMPLDQYGENLANKASMADPPSGVGAATWAVGKWYDEVSHFPFDAPGTGNMGEWGHFSALVWKSAQKMGIGIAHGTKKSKSGNTLKAVYVVARFLPPCNLMSDMKENVSPAQY